jgi:uncharacterized protein (TIGR00296 family)
VQLTDDEGRAAVAIARSALDTFVKSGSLPKGSENTGFLAQRRGAFVTLKVAADSSLRGCIGFPLPVMRAAEALARATVAAASEDPRFPAVRPEELDSLLVEVSLLTLPEEIKVAKKSEMPSHVVIGRDGLIVSRGPQSGLLLPQVAPEFGLSQTDFLSQTCMKAGLLPDAWLLDGVKVERFQAEVFAEEEPRGRVVRLKS